VAKDTWARFYRYARLTPVYLKIAIESNPLSTLCRQPEDFLEGWKAKKPIRIGFFVVFDLWSRGELVLYIKLLILLEKLVLCLFGCYFQCYIIFLLENHLNSRQRSFSGLLSGLWWARYFCRVASFGSLVIQFVPLVL